MGAIFGGLSGGSCDPAERTNGYRRTPWKGSAEATSIGFPRSTSGMSFDDDFLLSRRVPHESVQSSEDIDEDIRLRVSLEVEGSPFGTIDVELRFEPELKRLTYGSGNEADIHLRLTYLESLSWLHDAGNDVAAQLLAQNKVALSHENICLLSALKGLLHLRRTSSPHAASELVADIGQLVRYGHARNSAQVIAFFDQVDLFTL